MSIVAAVHDLSGVGRCSLTTALAVLPVMGHTCYPLPTAVLSQQTAFKGYSFLDFTPYMREYFAGWQKLDMKPDIIYTGFLGNGSQAKLIAEYAAAQKDCLVLVDPVMGDDNALYSCFDAAFVSDMSELVQEGDIIVPNATEFSLLCGLNGDTGFFGSDAAILSMASKINAPKLKHIVVTGVAEKEDLMYNIVVDIVSKEVTRLPTGGNNIAYSGTGDLFASVMCGLLAQKLPVIKCVELAASFVLDAVNNTPKDSDPKYGISYEAILRKLCRPPYCPCSCRV